MAGMTWLKTFDAMVVTPMRPGDVVIGLLLYWVVTRLTLVCSVFVLVIILFRAVGPAAGVMALPFAVLTGLAFAAPIMAYAATQRTDTMFSAIFRFLITPLFIFSGTFFPITQLPAVIQPIAWFLPLYHGVELTRGIALGTLDPLGMVSTAALVAFVVIGVFFAFRTFKRRLMR